MKTKKVRPIVFIGATVVGLVFSIFLYIHPQASAQTTSDSGLTISPPTFELSLNPGERTSNYIRLENRNNYPVKIAVDLRNFTALGEEGGVDLTYENTNFSLANWISIDKNEYVLPGKSNRTYKFDVSTPSNAEPGGHFGSIIFRTIPTESLSGSGASLAQEIGSLILVKVSGPTTEEADIASFATTKKIFEYGPVTFDARIENLGNVHLKPRGVINITNILGRTVGTLELENKNVLPGAIRKIEGVWNTKSRFGRYTATLVLVYGRDQVQRAAITNFYLIPYKLLAVIFVVVLVLSMLAYRSRKRISKALKILFTGKE